MKMIIFLLLILYLPSSLALDKKIPITNEFDLLLKAYLEEDLSLSEKDSYKKMLVRLQEKLSKISQNAQFDNQSLIAATIKNHLRDEGIPQLPPSTQLAPFDHWAYLTAKKMQSSQTKTEQLSPKNYKLLLLKKIELTLDLYIRFSFNDSPPSQSSDRVTLLESYFAPLIYTLSPHNKESAEKGTGEADKLLSLELSDVSPDIQNHQEQDSWRPQ